jgi:hypothetical protein
MGGMFPAVAADDIYDSSGQRDHTLVGAPGNFTVNDRV